MQNTPQLDPHEDQRLIVEGEKSSALSTLIILGIGLSEPHRRKLNIWVKYLPLICG
jgi:hypothetical protein